MNIGVNATSWQNKRGYGRYERSLLTALFQVDKNNVYTLVFDDKCVPEDLPGRVNIQIVDVRHPTTIAASSSGRRSLSDMWRVSKVLSTSKFDLVIFPTIYSYVPVFSSAEKIVIIHDVIPEIFPQYAHPNQIARLAWQAKSALGRWQAEVIGTVSEYSKQSLMEYFHLPNEKIFVIGEASDGNFRVLDPTTFPPNLQSLGIVPEKGLITYVGGFGPHKNLSMLIDVFSKLSRQPEFMGIQLVMVGENQREVFHSEINELREKIKASGLKEKVIFTGFIPDDHLANLLNLSMVLVLPSFMEGFGLPAVEAAACGCPVIATKASPLPKLLGKGGVYIDPEKPEELLAALDRVLSSASLRQEMREEGLKAARELTWEAAAKQLLQVIQKVAQA